MADIFDLLASLSGGQAGQGVMAPQQAPMPQAPPPPPQPPPQQGTFGQIMGGIGNVLQAIGGHAVDFLGNVNAFDKGGLQNYWMRQQQMLNDPNLRPQLEQSQFLRSSLGQWGPLPPLSQEAQAEQAKQQFQTQLYQRATSGDPAALQALHMGGAQVVENAGYYWITEPNGSLRLIKDQPYATSSGATGGGGEEPGYGEELVPEPAPGASPASPQVAPPTPGARPGVVANRAPEPTYPMDQTAGAAPMPAGATPPPVPPAQTPAPAGIPPGMTRMYIRPGTHVAHTPTGDVYSSPIGFSAKGKPEMHVYDPTVPPKTVPVSPNTYRAWAAGIDPATQRPATPEQRAQGQAYEKQLLQEHRQKAEASSAARPMTQGTQDTLTVVANVHKAADELRQLLKDPKATGWLGPLWGNLAWQGYQKAGVVANPAIAHFITINELFKIESAGRLARLAGSRSRAIWQELTVHPPHPGDSLALINTKLDDIDRLTSDIGRIGGKLASMPRRKAEAFMAHELGPETPAPGAPAQGPANPAEGMPGVTYGGSGF